MKFKKIYIEITNICNKNCSFCSKTNRKKREMSIDEFETVLKRINNYTDYIYLHIKGEPLTHSSFEEIVKLCKKYNKKINLTTNGVLISKYPSLFYDEENFRQVNISFHSYDNENDMGNIIQCIDNIRKINKKTYFVYRYWTLNETNKNYISLKKIIKKIYNIELNNKMNIKLGNNLYLNKDYEFIWPSLNNSLDNDGFCYGLKTHIGILSDGTVVPCCLDSEGIVNLGNIFLEDLETILTKERTKKIINGFKNNKRIESLCRHCSFKN